MTAVRPRGRGTEPSATPRRVELEKRRDFLLRSIEDLDRELRDGEITAEDHRRLRDDYAARAAVVLRALDEEPETPEPGEGTAGAAGAGGASRRRSRMAWLAGLGAFAGLAAVVLVAFVGERDSGDSITGDIPSSTAGLLARADECAAEGDLECAIESYGEVLEIDPRHAEALTYQAWYRADQGEVEAALEQLDRAVDLDPTFLDAHAFRVIVLSRQDRVEEAQATIGELVAAGDEDIALGVAERLFGAGQAVEALQVYDAILAEDPDHARALAWRGWVVALAGLDEEAIGYLDRAAEVDPELPDAHAFRAVVLDRLGRSDEAAEALRAFDASDPPEQMRAIVDGSGIREDLDVPAPDGP